MRDVVMTFLLCHGVPMNLDSSAWQTAFALNGTQRRVFMKNYWS